MIVELRRWGGHVQRLTYDDFERRVRDGEVPPDTPIRFEAVTGERFVPARELEFYRELADPQRLAFRRSLSRRGVPIVTALLVGFQIRVYLWSWAPGAEDWLQEHFTNWAPAVLERAEVWRLISYGLLHVSFTHLLFNLIFLAYTGYHLERALGRANLLLIYFTSVFLGGLLSMSMAPDRPSLGASGGDFGLLAAAVLLGWKHQGSIPRKAWKYFGWALVPWIVFSIFTGLTARNVDNWSHLGGLVGGTVLMTLLDPELLPGRKAINRTVRWVTVALLLVVSGMLASWGGHLVPLERLDEGGWSVKRPTYWREGWTFAGDRGWFSPTLQANVAATTTVHPHPLSAEQAADNLVARVGSGGRKPTVIARSPLSVGAWDGERLVLRFSLTGQPQVITAEVLARGMYEYRVQFQSVAEVNRHYEPLVARILDSIEVGEPEELVEARANASNRPGSWKATVKLAEALYRAGDVTESLAAFERARRLAPDEPRVIEGMLRVYADYGVPGGLEVARAVLDDGPADPRVIVAAADVMASSGNRTEAIEVLDKAWKQMPGDHVLRRTRLLWGLPVDLPSNGAKKPGLDGGG